MIIFKIKLPILIVPFALTIKLMSINLTYHGSECDALSMLILYHCPFCGGCAPESQRELLFVVIPDSEEARLAKVLSPINTMEDAITTLGKPDFDSYTGSHLTEQDRQPPRIEHHRTIRYAKLSDVAEIWITERQDGQIYWQLQGKPIKN